MRYLIVRKSHGASGYAVQEDHPPIVPAEEREWTRVYEIPKFLERAIYMRVVFSFLEDKSTFKEIQTLTKV